MTINFGNNARGNHRRTLKSEKRKGDIPGTLDWRNNTVAGYSTTSLTHQQKATQAWCFLNSNLMAKDGLGRLIPPLDWTGVLPTAPGRPGDSGKGNKAKVPLTKCGFFFFFFTPISQRLLSPHLEEPGALAWGSAFHPHRWQQQGPVRTPVEPAKPNRPKIGQ